MNNLICPGCGDSVSSVKLHPGDIINCPNCANLTLKLGRKEGRLVLVEVPKASCPSCDRLLILPDNVQPGDLVQCCGKNHKITYEFGSYALE